MTLLSVRGLRLVRGGRTLLDGFDFSVASAETVAIQGPSGSGKSTLLRALAGLDPVDAGTIELDGQTLEALGAPVWRSRVRYLPQGSPNLAGTPRQTAALIDTYAATPAGSDPITLAESWFLPADRWDQPWSRLSGGEAQRALLALALCRPADVLLLDEPTSALDPAAAEAVEASLKGRTCLWVTHEAVQAAQADRTLTLDGP